MITDFEKAFNQHIDAMRNHLKVKSGELDIDLSKAEEYVVEIDQSLEFNGVNESLYNLGAASTYYKLATAESLEYSDRVTCLAIASAHFSGMGGGNVQNFLSDFGRANAFKRHAETYQLKNDVIKHWTENIDPQMKNDRAAELLKKVFPLSHRKLSQYVAEAKKIHQASKA